MKKGSFFVNVVLCIFVVLLAYYFYLGGFRAVEFNLVPQSSFEAVVTSFNGSNYADEGLVEVRNYLEEFLVDSYLDVRMFGDDFTPFGRGEYLVGSILDRVEFDKVEDLGNYSVATFSEGEYLKSVFPYRTKVSGLNFLSKYIASYRVGSALDEEVVRRNATLESVVVIDDKIEEEFVYLFEIESVHLD